jgi:hypothetical protein
VTYMTSTIVYLNDFGLFVPAILALSLCLCPILFYTSHGPIFIVSLQIPFTFGFKWL